MNSNLTEREMQVLSLMCDGLNRPAIAKRLSLSSWSIETHTTQIFKKLWVRNTRQAVAYAVTHGLVRVNKVNP